MMALLPPLLASLSSPPEQTIIIEHLPKDLAPVPEGIKTTAWNAFCSKHDSPAVEYAPTGFNDPIWILFSSGTTGKPKAIVHRHGAMLLDTLREHHLQGDMARGDVYMYYTTP